MLSKELDTGNLFIDTRVEQTPSLSFYSPRGPWCSQPCNISKDKAALESLQKKLEASGAFSLPRLSSLLGETRKPPKITLKNVLLESKEMQGPYEAKFSLLSPSIKKEGSLPVENSESSDPNEPPHCSEGKMAQENEDHSSTYESETSHTEKFLNLGKQEPLLSVKTVQFGTKGTLQQRIFFKKNGWYDASPLHDIPLHGPDGLMYFVCTTPKGQWIKYEVGLEETHNPLRVVKNKGKPSHFAQNVKWNYGFFPQSSFTGGNVKKKDNTRPNVHTPVYVFDLSSIPERRTGDVYLVKPLMAYFVSDKGNLLSLQVVAIDREDPKAELISNSEDIQRYFPGALSGISSWLQNRNCLKPGDGEAIIAFNGNSINLETLMLFLNRSHDLWETKFCHKTCESCSGPLSVSDLQKIWLEQTSSESPESIQVSKPAFEATHAYERAWADLIAQESQSEVFRESKSQPVSSKNWKTWTGSMNISQRWETSLKWSFFSPKRDLQKSKTETFVPLKFKSHL